MMNTLDYYHPALVFSSSKPIKWSIDQILSFYSYYETIPSSVLNTSDVISYTESYRDLQQSYLAIQESYRTRKFELECSISAPVGSSKHRNWTYPTLKKFLRFFNYRSFEGVEAPKAAKTWLRSLQLSYRDWKFVRLAPKLAVLCVYNIISV